VIKFEKPLSELTVVLICTEIYYCIFSNALCIKKKDKKLQCAAYSRTDIGDIAVFRYMIICLLF
jgi:hypothetical protein